MLIVINKRCLAIPGVAFLLLIILSTTTKQAALYIFLLFLFSYQVVIIWDSFCTFFGHDCVLSDYTRLDICWLQKWDNIWYENMYMLASKVRQHMIREYVCIKCKQLLSLRSSYYMKLKHTYLEIIIIGLAEIWDKVFPCLSHAPNLGFSRANH